MQADGDEKMTNPRKRPSEVFTPEDLAVLHHRTALRPAELAALHGCCISKVYKWTKAGILKNAGARISMAEYQQRLQEGALK